MTGTWSRLLRSTRSIVRIVITVLLTFIALRLQGTDVARNAAGGA